jgi:hypothetical protein
MFSALLAQSGVLLVGTLVALSWQGGWAGLAVLYGGAVTMANTGLLALRWWQGLTEYHCDGPRHLKAFRRSNMERFFVVVLLMAAGLFGLRLQPGFVLTGFISGQLAWIVALAVLRAD